MKTLISILIIYFLSISSQSLFAADVTSCPFSKFEGFGGVSFNEDGTLKKQKISKEYKKLFGGKE